MSEAKMVLDRIREGKFPCGMSQPVCGHFRNIPTVPLEQIAELEDERDGLNVRCEALAEQIADLKADLALNAAMLARQTDLAREAENERDEDAEVMFKALARAGDAEVRLAAAMKALEEAKRIIEEEHFEKFGRAVILKTRTPKLFAALADMPQAVKRLRAIEEAAEETINGCPSGEPDHSCARAPDEDCHWYSLCKAVREERE